MKLAALQTIFTRALDPASDAMTRARATTLLLSGGALAPLERLHIYQHNVTSAHQRAMEIIFPVCQQILGEAVFGSYCRDYSWARSTASPDLNQYGEMFSQYMAEQIVLRDELRDYPYLSDLCSLEFMWHSAYYAADDPDFDFERFAHLQANSAGLVFDLSDSLRLMQSDYPILQLWQQHKNGTLDDSVEGLGRSQYLLLYRRAFSTEIVALKPSQFAFLQGCQRGETLATQAGNENTADALASLSGMIEQGWITGFHHV